jgi:type I restriction enzyme M protein
MPFRLARLSKVRFRPVRIHAVKDNIEGSLPTRGGKTRSLTKEDFSQLSAIFLREKAQFDHLVSLPDSEDRAKAIIATMDSIEADYDSLPWRPAQG